MGQAIQFLQVFYVAQQTKTVISVFAENRGSGLDNTVTGDSDGQCVLGRRPVTSEIRVEEGQKRSEMPR